MFFPFKTSLRQQPRVWACSSAWLERTPDKREVGSSSLPRPTIWGCSSVGRALPLQGRCRRFESVQLQRRWSGRVADCHAARPCSFTSEYPVARRKVRISGFGQLCGTRHRVNRLALTGSRSEFWSWRIDREKREAMTLRRHGQAMKSSRWMPWRQEAMKDVV